MRKVDLVPGAAKQLSQTLWSLTFASVLVELLSRHRVRPL